MQLSSGAGPPLAPAGLWLSPVEVDLAGLDDFRTLVGRELDGNLRPAADGIVADHRRGVGFGDRTIGSSIQTARLKYHETLSTSTTNLAAYVEAAEILIEAIRRVLRNYRDSDLTSAAGSAAVGRELTGAMVAARQVQMDALEAARARAREARLHRHEFDVAVGQ